MSRIRRSMITANVVEMKSASRAVVRRVGSLAPAAILKYVAGVSLNGCVDISVLIVKFVDNQS